MAKLSNAALAGRLVRLIGAIAQGAGGDATYVEAEYLVHCLRGGEKKKRHRSAYDGAEDDDVARLLGH